MSLFTLVNLNNVARQLGRGVVFYANAWNGTAPLTMTHMGDTEGDIVMNVNSAYSYLIATEVRGPAKLLGYEDGSDPIIDMAFWMGDPAMRALITPTTSGSIGHSRRRPVREFTLAIFPEEMFLDVSDSTYQAVTYDGTDWLMDAVPFTAAQTRFLGSSIWAWRGHFTRPPVTMRHGEAGKSLESTQFQVMVSDTRPEGHQLVTLGDPELAGVVIEVGV